MTTEEKTALVASAGKRLGGVLGLESVVVQWPTPGDQIAIDEKMEEIASRSCVNPLAFVQSTPEAVLSGNDRVNAIAIAIEKGAGGGVSPSGKAMARAYYSLEGVRYRLWRLTRRTQPGLSEADIEAKVTDANRPDLIDALDNLLKLLDPKGPPPGGGA